MRNYILILICITASSCAMPFYQTHDDVVAYTDKMKTDSIVLGKGSYWLYSQIIGKREAIDRVVLVDSPYIREKDKSIPHSEWCYVPYKVAYMQRTKMRDLKDNSNRVTINKRQLNGAPQRRYVVLSLWQRAKR